MICLWPINQNFFMSLNFDANISTFLFNQNWHNYQEHTTLTYIQFSCPKKVKETESWQIR